ncbi:aspartate carbamoyltransferase regulatory subunit [Geosporobacter ferrireducens]|uniref:Aspartate carbamoyltransferase regulatory subunit n=1 Tax=Geosporobacter ferrireducens TaxID=1424294 RepID=A0A1D8GKB8_9FIRM|nr:aspartate carbamoyltransferase regulatory subunit [Geosporobacter ferrireducens]AOT71360.1 aspartate carbamoyltransferase regulatory subunit [Geosporobacter ferrireducens]MTI57672.1 aspartate carbamoyltransferase regulatory subunit [Geosporobacter ferrireducens]
MLEVTSIKKGIVLDHITSGNGLKIFNKLMLDKVNYPVVLLMNVPSKQMNRKDIIKIENNIDIDLDFLGLIDHNITMNIIEDNKIVHKKKVEIPQKVNGLFKCHNPRCITNFDDYVKPTFQLVASKNLEYKCDYCEELTAYKL